MIARTVAVIRWGLTLAVAGGAALVAALAIEHTRPVVLPVPTGPLAVGRVSLDWRDDTAVDPFAPTAGVHRELIAWIWYPASGAPGVAPYLPDAVSAAVIRNRGWLMGHLLTCDLSKVRVHGVANAAVAPAQPAYPVVIMRTGGSAEAWNYTTLAEDLASHGYVVVGFDAPYRTNTVVLPDGTVLRRRPENNPESCEEKAGEERSRCVERMVRGWAGDIGFALDRLAELNAADPAGRFTGRLDLSRAGVFGHSFGGATAAEFCREDTRCKAGIDVDGELFGDVVRSGVRRPFMFLMSDHGDASVGEAREVTDAIRSVYDRLPASGRRMLMIRGANHFFFSDDAALLKSRILIRMLRLFGFAGIDGRRQLAIAAFSIRGFFDEQLKGLRSSNVPSPEYPELRPFR